MSDKLSKEDRKKFKEMYLAHTGIRDICNYFSMSEKDVMNTLSEMGIRRMVGKKQLELEEKYKRMIFDYWDKLGHEVEVYSNQYGDVRTDMVNGLPRYLKTTKYLYKK